MLKKTLSWVLLVALLLSCMIFPSLALEPQSDTAAVDSGYQFKYETGSGTVYGKFEKGNATLDNTLDSQFIPEGSTVTLLTDITLNKRVYLRNKLTIDGNGHTVTGAAFRSADVGTGNRNADVTIKNVNFVCALSGSSVFEYFYQINADNRCVFENCTFTLSGNVAYGFFVPRGDLSFRNCRLTVTSTNDLSGNFLFLPESDNQIKVTNSTFDITGAGKLQPGIMAGYNGTYYNSYSKAFAQVPAAGGTVTLLAGYEIVHTDSKDGRAILTCGVASNVTFDGQGQTIIGNTGSYLVRVDSNMTIQNLNIKQTGAAAMQINSPAKLTLAASTVTTTAKTPYGAVIVNGHLVMERGAKIVSQGAANGGTESVAIRLHSAGATATINEGAEISTSHANIVKANAADNTTFTVNGGTITTGRWLWESNVSGHTITVNGGTFICNSSNPLIQTYGTKTPTVNLCGGTYTTQNGKPIVDTQGAIKKLGGTIVLNGKTILKAPGAEDLKTMGAALYLPTNATQENSGIRFETRLSKAWIDELIASGATVTTGTLLAPKALVEKLGGLTLEALNGKGLHIENDGWNNAATATADGYYRYFGNMIQLSLKSLTGEIAGVGYVTVTVPGYGTVTYYGPVQSGIVREIAKTVATDGLNPAQQEVLRFFAGSQVTTTP